MSEYTECPNCNSKIKTTVFSMNEILHEQKVRLINEFSDQKKDAYCNKCGDDLFTASVGKLNTRIQENYSIFRKELASIPVITTHTPLNWDYEILDMVTGQTTTGTGVLSEFTSSISDLFGKQSSSYNAKLKAGEDLCLSQLRTQAIKMGGNAVIATDIDYSEVGGDKGMLMVCMAGTAVKVKNMELLGKRPEGIAKAVGAYNKIQYLSSLK